MNIEQIIAEVENKLYENTPVTKDEIRALINYIRENKDKDQ